MTYLLDQSGRIRDIPDVNVEFYVENGWSRPSDDQVKQFEDSSARRLADEKYSTVGQTLKAGAEGALRGLTFGGSDWLEEKIFDNAEDIKGREEASPVASFGGEVLGMALPALIPGVGEAAGASQAAKAAAGGVSIASKASKALDVVKAAVGYSPAGLGYKAEKAIVGSLLKRELPQTSGLLARTVERAGAEALGQVPMSVAMGIGEALHENALGDPNYTAESLLANPGRIVGDVGEAVLFNSVLGGMISGGAGLSKAGVTRVGNALAGNRVLGMLDSVGGSFGLRSTRAGAGDIRRVVEAKGADAAKEIGREARSLGILRNPRFDSVDGILERANALKQESGMRIGAILDDADEVYEAARADAAAKWDIVDSPLPMPSKQAATGGSRATLIDSPKALDDVFAEPPGPLASEQRRRGLPATGVDRIRSTDIDVEMARALPDGVPVQAPKTIADRRLADFINEAKTPAAKNTVVDRPWNFEAMDAKYKEHLRKGLNPNAGLTTWEAIEENVRKPIVNALRSEGHLVPIAKQFEQVLENYAVAYGGKPIGVSTLGKLKSDIGEFIYNQGNVLDPWAKKLNLPVNRVYNHIDDLIEKGVRDALGDAGVKALKDANRKFEVAATMSQLATKGAKRSDEAAQSFLSSAMSGGIYGTVMGHAPLGIAMGFGIQAAETRGASAISWGAAALREAFEPKAAVLGALAKNSQNMTSSIKEAMASLVSRGEAVGRVAKVPATMALIDAEKTTKEREAEFRKRASELRVASDPSVMMERASAIGAELHDHAPNTSLAAVATAARAIGFLSSKLPSRPEPTTASLIAGYNDEQPSAREIERFDRYYNAVLDPKSIVKSVAAGRLTAEEVEAVSVVYPLLFKQMQMAALEGIQKARGEVPRRVRNSVDLLVGNEPSTRSKVVQGAFASGSGEAKPSAPKQGTKKAPEDAAKRASLRRHRE